MPSSAEALYVIPVMVFGNLFCNFVLRIGAEEKGPGYFSEDELFHLLEGVPVEPLYPVGQLSQLSHDLKQTSTIEICGFVITKLLRNNFFITFCKIGIHWNNVKSYFYFISYVAIWGGGAGVRGG